MRPLSWAMLAVAGLSSWAAPVGAQSVVELPGEDRPLRATTEPVLSIGGIDAPEWAAFGRVDELAFDAAGNLYALDTRNSRVIVVGRDGGFLRRIGREGEGPGEFQLPADIAVSPSGELVVVDRLQDRFSRFDADGALIADASALVGAGSPRSIHPHPAGGVVGDAFVYLSRGRPRTQTAEGFREVDHRPIQRYLLARGEEGAGGAPAELLHRARLVVRPVDAQGRPYLTAFFPEFHWTVLPDGRAVLSDTAAYRLTVVGARGGVERVLHRPLGDRPVAAADRERERERLLTALAAGRAPEATVSMGPRPSPEEMERRHRSRIEQMRFPAVFPRVRALASDASGRIWVERTGEDPHGRGPIDVLTPDGEYLGTLPPGDPGMPAAFGPDGLAAYVTLDELDVATIRVVRLRLSSPVPTRPSGSGAAVSRR